MRIENCRQLLKDYSREDILADKACVVQCNYAMEPFKQNVHTSSMAMLIEMLEANKRKK